MVPEWLLLGSVLALAGLNAALSAYWLRRLQDGADGSGELLAAADDRPADEPAADGTVRCRSCGARNQAEYRFCRECVTELPISTPSTSGAAGPRGRPF